VNASLAFIEGAKPRDEIECALVIQMACTHSAAMAVLNRLGGAAGERTVAAMASAADALGLIFDLDPCSPGPAGTTLAGLRGPSIRLGRLRTPIPTGGSPPPPCRPPPRPRMLAGARAEGIGPIGVRGPPCCMGCNTMNTAPRFHSGSVETCGML
jgi:hypothetical protein